MRSHTRMQLYIKGYNPLTELSEAEQIRKTGQLIAGPFSDAKYSQEKALLFMFASGALCVCVCVCMCVCV